MKHFNGKVGNVIYASALGISVGDQVRTSYGTRDEVHHIHGPYYWGEVLPGVLLIRTWPVIYLGLGGNAGIGDIRQDGERWFTDGGDEIFITHRQASPRPAQIELFDESQVDPRSQPYQFMSGVDYTYNVWKCRHCGDFNAPPENEHLRRRWNCTICGKWKVDYKIILMTPRVYGKQQQNAYLTALGVYSYREQMEIENMGLPYIHYSALEWHKQREKIETVKEC
jgi:hypothetical protein